MTQATFAKILDIVADEPSLIWQIVYPSLEPPPEEARYVALAALATSDWLPAALSCMRLLLPEETDANAWEVNRPLRKFLSSLAVRSPGIVLEALRPLIADKAHREFALAVLEDIDDLAPEGQEVPTLDFLLEYEQASHEWTNNEYDRYTQAFLANGIDKALDAVKALQERLPQSEVWKHDWLVGNIEHLHNLQKREDFRTSPEDFTDQVAWAAEWLENYGVLELIKRDS